MSILEMTQTTVRTTMIQSPLKMNMELEMETMMRPPKMSTERVKVREMATQLMTEMATQLVKVMASELVREVATEIIHPIPSKVVREAATQVLTEHAQDNVKDMSPNLVMQKATVIMKNLKQQTSQQTQQQTQMTQKQFFNAQASTHTWTRQKRSANNISFSLDTLKIFSQSVLSPILTLKQMNLAKISRSYTHSNQSV